MTSLSRTSASAPSAAAQNTPNSEPRIHRVFGWDKNESTIPAQSSVRFTCRPTAEIGSPQYRTDFIRVSDLQNPDPARYNTIDRLCGYWAREMERHFALGTLDPSTDEAWTAFSTEAAALPACLTRPKSA